LNNVRAGLIAVLLALTPAKRVVRRRMEGMLSVDIVLLVLVGEAVVDQNGEAEQ